MIIQSGIAMGMTAKVAKMNVSEQLKEWALK